MTMTAEELKRRTKGFAIRVIRLVESLPKERTADVIGKQLLRAATSVGANYRAACRERSRAEFCSKMEIVEEEADEAAYWIELLVETNLIREALVKKLLKEADEIAGITVASINTARNKDRERKR